MKQQQHDINFEEDSEKNSESQMGFEPTTLRDLVGCSNHLSYWRLYGEQGPICGSRLEPHHAATQPSNDITWIFDMFIPDRIDRELHSLKCLDLKFGL